MSRAIKQWYCKLFCGYWHNIILFILQYFRYCATIRTGKQEAFSEWNQASGLSKNLTKGKFACPEGSMDKASGCMV